MFALFLEYFLLCCGAQVTTSMFFMSKILFECDKQNLQKIPRIFITLMGFVRQILIKLETPFIWGFLELPLWCPLGSSLCKHASGHSVATEACTSLARLCVVWTSGSSMELSALCGIHQCTNPKIQLSHIPQWAILIEKCTCEYFFYKIIHCGIYVGKFVRWISCGLTLAVAVSVKVSGTLSGTTQIHVLSA